MPERRRGADRRCCRWSRPTARRRAGSGRRRRAAQACCRRSRERSYAARGRTLHDLMRLIVARCEVSYTGRLTARLPEALRLLMIKADGVRARARRRRRLQAAQLDDPSDRDRGGARPDRRPQAQGRRPAGDPDRRGDLGLRARDGPQGRRRPGEGRRRGPPPGGARRRARLVRRGLPARAARVADRHRPGRPDVPRRGGRLDRGGDQAHRHDRRGRAAHALPRADPARPRARRVPRRARRAGREAPGPRARGGPGHRAGSRSTSPCCGASASPRSRCLGHSSGAIRRSRRSSGRRAASSSGTSAARRSGPSGR